MRFCFLVAAGLLFGCSSADFEVGSTGADAQVDSSPLIEDGSAPPDDTGAPVADSGAPSSDTSLSSADTALPPLDASLPDGCAMSTSPDFYSTGYTSAVASISADTTSAISFVMRRTGTPVSVTFALQRIVIDTVKASGTLRVRLIKGAPTKTPLTADVLGAWTINGSALTDMPSLLALGIPGVPVLAKGQLLWFELTDGSDREDFRVYGASGSSFEVDVWTPVGPGYAKVTSNDPYLVVSVKSCP